MIFWSVSRIVPGWQPKSRTRGSRTALSTVAPLATVALLALSGPAAAGLVQYSVFVEATSGSAGVDPTDVSLANSLRETFAVGGSSATVSYTPAAPGQFPSIGAGASTLWPSGISPGGPGENHRAFAGITVSDTFILNKPASGPGSGPNEFFADLSFSIGLSGFITQSGGNAGWGADAQLRGLVYRDAGGNFVQPTIGLASSGATPTAGPSQGLPATLNSAILPSGSTSFFPFGEPITLFWSLGTSVDGFPSGVSGAAGSATADLTNTAVWLGIIGRDAQGQIMEGLTFTSESGANVNWGPAIVIPLPATAWLLLTALGAAGLRAARRADGRTAR